MAPLSTCKGRLIKFTMMMLVMVMVMTMTMMMMMMMMMMMTMTMTMMMMMIVCGLCMTLSGVALQSDACHLALPDFPYFSHGCSQADYRTNPYRNIVNSSE